MDLNESATGAWTRTTRTRRGEQKRRSMPERKRKSLEGKKRRASKEDIMARRGMPRRGGGRCANTVEN
jgi:hypothetical protein